MEKSLINGLFSVIRGWGKQALDIVACYANLNVGGDKIKNITLI
jgi:hypothetical protein